MEVLESFYKNGKSIIGFLILVLIFNMIFDTALTEKFVLLVLFSMIVINSEKFIDFFSNAFGGSEEKSKAKTDLSDSRTTQDYQNGTNQNGRFYA